MPLTLDHTAWTQWITLEDGTSHPRQAVVDFGRPGMRYSVSMRELIHRTAFHLDACDDDDIINHRAAVVLRQIAEEYYPPLSDTGDLIAEELLEIDPASDFAFVVPPAPRVDARLFDLIEGYICASSTFGEVLWSDEEPTPSLSRNSRKTLDFPFPKSAVERFGISGIRMMQLDLIHWLRSSIDLGEMAFENEELWLDALDLSHRRSQLNYEHRRAANLCARYGDAKMERDDHAEPNASNADAILRELGGLIG